MGQFALLDRTEVVAGLLDAGWDVDTRGWSGFTPLDQAAMHGRRATAELLIERGANLADRACGGRGPTPLDCALWGIRNNPAHDGDYVGTVERSPRRVRRRSTSRRARTPPSTAVLERHSASGEPPLASMRRD